jgi:hypothetical protein
MSIKRELGSSGLTGQVEAIAKENIMTRISTFCVVSSTLAVIALSANGASATTITVHPTVPRVTVHTPQAGAARWLLGTYLFSKCQ